MTIHTLGREGKTEALGLNERQTPYSSGANPTADGALAAQVSDPFDTSSPSYDSTTGGGMSTANAEALGDVEASNGFAQMAFSIEKATVTAKSKSA